MKRIKIEQREKSKTESEMKRLGQEKKETSTTEEDADYWYDREFAQPVDNRTNRKKDEDWVKVLQEIADEYNSINGCEELGEEATKKLIDSDYGKERGNSLNNFSAFESMSKSVRIDIF